MLVAGDTFELAIVRWREKDDGCLRGCGGGRKEAEVLGLRQVVSKGTTMKS